MSAFTTKGVALAFYNGGDWDAIDPVPTRHATAQIQPSVVCPHAGPRGILDPKLDRFVAQLRKDAPKSELWLGVGLDGWTSALAAAPKRVGEIATLLQRTVQRAKDLGATRIVWDPEVASEVHPKAGTDVAKLALGYGDDYGLRQALTTFDAPVHLDKEEWGGHEQFPWKVWLGDSGVDLYLPQLYVAARHGVAERGALLVRKARAQQSIELARKRWNFRPDLDLRWYLQGHHTDGGDIGRFPADGDFVAIWAAPFGSTLDGEGVAGARALQQRFCP